MSLERKGEQMPSKYDSVSFSMYYHKISMKIKYLTLKLKTYLGLQIRYAVQCTRNGMETQNDQQG